MSFDFSAFLNNNNNLQSILQSTISSFASGSSFGSSFGSSLSTNIFSGTSVFGTYGSYNTNTNNGIYNKNGYNVAYNQAGQAKTQQNTAIIISILSLTMPFAAKLLQSLISGLVTQKAGEIARQNPTTDSAVVRGAQQETVKQQKANLENEILNDQKLVETLQNISNPGTSHDDISLQANNQNNTTIINNLKNLSAGMSQISPDFSEINSQLYENIDIKFDGEFPDNLTEISNFGEIQEHFSQISDYSGKLDNFISDIKNINITMDDINFDNDSDLIQLNNELNMLSSGEKPDQNKIAAKQQQIEEYKNTKLQNLQDAIDTLKKDNIEQAKCQQDDLATYEEMLNQLEMDLDSLTSEERSALESKLNDGSLTFDELLELQCKEDDERSQALSDMINKNGDIDTQIKQANDRIAKNTDKLKLLDFANEGFKALDKGSDISRKQARQLRQEAQRLYDIGGTYSQLQDYATSLGISLTQNEGTDTNKNGVTDDWSNTATSGVKLSDFAANVKMAGVTSDEIIAHVGRDGNTTITSDEAAEVREYLSHTKTKNEFIKAKMGNLVDNNDALNILNNNIDKFNGRVNKEEQQIALTQAKTYSKAKPQIESHLKEVGAKDFTVSINDQGSIEVTFKYNNNNLTVSGANMETVNVGIDNSIRNLKGAQSNSGDYHNLQNTAEPEEYDLPMTK